MNFICQNCLTKYRIDEITLSEQITKVLCKKCQNVIVIRRTESKCDISRGKPIEVIDTLGNIMSISNKLLLMSMDIDSHNISQRNERLACEFIRYHGLYNVKVRLNEYSPINEISRFIGNHKVSAIIQCIIGWPMYISYNINIGRIFGGDYYNPNSDTVNIYSNHSAIILHELGHAVDFSKRELPGLYQLMRFIPFFALYQEYVASKYAIEFLRKKKYYEDELSAYKILYPAYSTYVFGAIYEFLPSVIFVWLYVPVIILGHIIGRFHYAIRKLAIGNVHNSNKSIEVFEPKPWYFHPITFGVMLIGFSLGNLVYPIWGGIVSAIVSYVAYRLYLMRKENPAKTNS